MEINMATMNIKVFYHSSTGNIEKLTRAIADTLNIQAKPLGEDHISFSEPVDLLFIGDGVYFGKANKKTRSFIDRLDAKMIKTYLSLPHMEGNLKLVRT